MRPAGKTAREVLKTWISMNDEICTFKRQLDIVDDKIEAKQKEKVDERFDLFRKKYDKIIKMTSDDDIKATEKDITKYENKVLIYIRYLAVQNQEEIDRRKAAN